MDIEDRKVVIRDPKSGREVEVVFLPQKVIDRLQKYVCDNGIKQDARIFPFTYAAARLIVKNAGDLVGIYLKPHDLQKHAATTRLDPEPPLRSIKGAAAAFEPVNDTDLPGQSQRC
ncbi:MAG: hypothetical protein Q7U40_15220 [Desulfatirhabdiaceae bacterium]|nr:hypothetical protein [Desulfatirhabdiaceae bacterium]